MRSFTMLFLLLSSLDIFGQGIVQRQAVQKVLDSMVIANEIPGLNFSVISGDQSPYNFSAGYENTNSQVVMNQKHLMLSGSIGKTYAAALIFQMIDEGQIGLDDLLIEHLPEETWLDSIPNIRKLNVRMLLSHTSGLQRWVMKPELWEYLYQNPDKEWSYRDRLAYIFNDPPVHEAGEGWAYSDTNYILLGFLIESLTGKPYYEVLKNRILDPYNLLETVPSNKRKIHGLAMSYSQLPPFFKIPKEVISTSGDYPFNPQMEWTGGGIASTTADLAKWGSIYFKGQPFSDSLLKQMTAVNPQGEKVYQYRHSYGMGSFIYHTEHGTAYGHSGFMPGYTSILAYYPENDLTLALQINCDYATRKLLMVGYLDEVLKTIMN